jgi:hypothetical protein
VKSEDAEDVEDMEDAEDKRDTTRPKHEDVLAALEVRKTWEQRQATWYQMRHDGLRRRNKPWAHAADMHFALADGILEKIKPTFVAQVYATDTIASFTALKSEWSNYQAGAAQWFDYQLKQESNFEEEFDIAIDKSAEAGLCPVKVWWNAEDGQVAFEAINPVYLIVPPWTGPLRWADWAVHVQRYSRAAYKALNPQNDAHGFKVDDETIDRILKGDGATGTAGESSYDTQVTQREGLTKGAKADEIVVWELCYRKLDGSVWVRTYSPTLPTEDLRPEFGLPYNRGLFAPDEKRPNKRIPLPFGCLRFETKERGYYAPRGVCERVKSEEASLSKDWNTIKDYQTLTCAPVFYAEQGVPTGANLRMVPGQIMPFKLAAVTFPNIPVDLFNGMQGTQRTAEERLSVPSVGVGRQVDPTKNKTAAETNLIASIMNQASDVRSRAFRRQLGEILNLAWSILIQYRGEALDYYFNEELLSLDRQALEGRYRIEPSGSGDNNNRAIVLQRAVSRWQMFKGDPDINQKELKRSVLEADDPRLVKRLLLDEGTKAAEQLEDQAQEITIMLHGFPAAVKPSDDHGSHLQSLVGFVQRRVQLREPLTAEFLRLVVMHAGQHMAGMKKQQPQLWQQKGQQMQAWLAEVKRQAQAAQQAEQMAQQQAQAGGNVVPMQTAAMGGGM